MSLQSKPPACLGCPLEHKGKGFAPSVGSIGALVAVVGEALGYQEAQQSQPFVGAAGVYLNRALALLGVPRDQFLVGNVVSCQPPEDWLVGAPWEQGAIHHCRTHRTLNIYARSPRVYLTLGVTATRTVLSDILRIQYQGKLDNWQSYVLGDGDGPFVVPSYHPAFLLRGQQRLLGALCFAIKRAMEVASFGHTPAPVSLVVDPEPDWFDTWASKVTPECWLATDIETAMKTGSDEDEMVVPVGAITRINFAITPDQGVTVPWDPRYFSTIRRLLSAPCPKVMWNERYDTSILRANEFPVSGVILDGMWGWHMLQSSLPRGLGFVSPYYSDLPPWKHLAGDNPGHYAAMDPVQTIRCMFGIARDLRQAGQWETYLRHIVQFDARVLHPMEEVGLKLDPTRLASFHAELQETSAHLLTEIQAEVPDHLRPLAGGWKNPPEGYPGSQVVARKVSKLVQCCDDCGAIDVTTRHKCPNAPVGKEIS